MIYKSRSPLLIWLLPISLLLFFLTVISSFTSAQIKQRGKIIRIDPEISYGGYAKEIFESIEYIPLETNEKSLLSKIQRFDVVDDRFIIYDNEFDQILIFSDNGVFINKINKIPSKNNRQKKSFSNYSIDPVKKNIIVKFLSDQYTYSNYFFDLTGRLLHSAPIPQEMDMFSSFEVVNGKFFQHLSLLHPLHPWNQDSSMHFLIFITNEEHQIEKKILPVDLSKDLRFKQMRTVGSRTFTPNKNNSLFFTKPFDYNIYSIGSDSIKHEFQFIFPMQYTFDTTLLKKPDFPENHDEYMNKNKDQITAIHSTYQQNQLLFFNFWNFSEISSHPFFYSLISGKLFDVTKITPDSSCYQLPIYSGFSVSKLLFVDENYAYFNLPANILLSAIQANSEKDNNYLTKLPKELAAKKRLDNSIIIKVRMKNSL